MREVEIQEKEFRVWLYEQYGIVLGPDWGELQDRKMRRSEHWAMQAA